MFSEKDTLVRLASGLWNCSVEWYSSIQHHVACNLKQECEDGRDETEHCVFSSPDCQGLVALCDSCYKLVETSESFLGQHINRKANEYCNELGTSLGFPECLPDWFGTFRNMTLIHPNGLSKWLMGLYSNDMSLPSLYRHSVIREDNTVFHHSVRVQQYNYRGERQCLTTFRYYPELMVKPCVGLFSRSSFRPLCEFRTNHTQGQDDRSKRIPLPSTQFPVAAGQQVVTICPQGHVSYTFLLCGSNRFKVCGQASSPGCTFSAQPSDMNNLHSADSSHAPVPMFGCEDQTTTLSYHLLCDFTPDCPDNSDESFCQHADCGNTFTCFNGQCLSYNQVCDQISHCHDGSDETNCTLFRGVAVQHPYTLSPSLVVFDNVKQFTSTPMDSTESCPGSHYRCPGELNDCLPVYTMCNGLFDCLGRQDEDGCEDMRCPGFFRCRESTTCVHSDHLCDGWPHCPRREDEILCDAACPVDCLCQGFSFLCRQPFHPPHFPHLRSLDATSSGMTLSDVSDTTYLVRLVLTHCSLTMLHDTKLLNLRFLDLRANTIQHVIMTALLGLVNLETLILSKNPLISLASGRSTVLQQRALTMVDLSHTSLTVLDPAVFLSFPNVQVLNLSFTSIHTISLYGFQPTPRLTELYLYGSPVKTFPADIFQGLTSLRLISSQSYKLCCKDTLPHNFDESYCYAPKDEVSSCADLLQSWTYRGFLWLIASLSLTGNVFCLCARLFSKSMTSNSGYSVFVTNLTMADFLMGVYMAVVGAADERYRGQYMQYDDTWKNSVTCKMAGFLSFLSNEVSALIIWLITMDRFIVIRFPFSNLRFEKRSALTASLITWLTGWFLAGLPLLPVTSHWEFYSQTGICIPLPVTRQEFKGKLYSFSILIVLNFLMFLLISVGQGFIYWSVQSNTLKTSSTKVSKDMTIAQRLISVAVTDFMCWFPIGLCGFLTLAGIPISGEVNVALAIFVLPLNSAINPFMYTFNTLAEKRRKSNEAKLLHWLESHPDLIRS
ncbi:hypothetical protein ACOMHN_056773 [Nucella lapillus]